MRQSFPATILRYKVFGGGLERKLRPRKFRTTDDFLSGWM
jgi:hypothetical protein